jgi:hypothetical protein
MGLLERLKSLFRPGGTEVEYQPRTDEGPVVVPAGPPAGQVPPVVPVEDPAAGAETGDDDGA